MKQGYLYFKIILSLLQWMNIQMSANDILKKWKRDNPQIENIVLFVSDALRWDYLPDTIAKRGILFKTIASSTFTASSFPSIVTGLYPQHHGIYSFFDQLPKGLQTLLNLPGYNTSFWMENTWIECQPPGSSQVHRILNFKKAIPLERLTPPFIYLEDEKGGHCPYGWTKNDSYKEIECRKFFHDYGKRSNKDLRERYQLGINRSTQVFEKRLQILEKRNLLDNTLVVFLSDHGELLGEYGGIVGHGYPTTPEIVYVPTVFIHPDLPAGVNFENEGVLRHIDLFPTILDLINIQRERNVDGLSLFTSEKLPEVGITYWKTEKNTPLPFIKYRLKEKSIWDKKGGYLFREGSNGLIQLIHGIYNITISKSIHALYLRGQIQQKKLKMIKNYVNILRNICFSPIKYGTPGFDIYKAKKFLKELPKTNIFIDEKYRIKKTIERLKQEGKI